MALQLNERWAEQAACKGFRLEHGTEEWTRSWFPEKGNHQTKAVQRALAICDECPVQAECLQYSLDANLVHGIYGGTTPQDRRDLFGQRIARYRPRRTELRPCGTYAAYRRHLARGEKPCEECRQAHALQARDNRPIPELMPCGTDAAFQRHKRRGEKPCEACHEANKAEKRAWRHNKVHGGA